MDIPEALISFVDNSVPFYTLKCYTTKLTPENVVVIFDYFMEFYLNKIRPFEEQQYDDTIKNTVRKYIHFVLDVMYQYDKPKEEIPPIVLEFVHLEWEEFKFHFYFRVPAPKPFRANDLMRCLKQGSSEFVSKFSLVQKNVKDDYSFKLNNVIRKLRIYFSNDIAKQLFKLYENTLTEYDLVKHAVDVFVYGIIQLGDKKYLNDFLLKYTPTEAKIDHIKIDRKLLSIQTAICSFAAYARPPVPLTTILKYIKGDYTLFCLPLFNMYLANLTPARCRDFVRAIVDSPLSVQKHGLRLAFKCFSIEELKKLIEDMWKRTKNVSLRFVIYKALHDKILDIDEEDKLPLFKTLNGFTSTVYEDDEKELFNLLTSNRLPANLLSQHLSTVWVTFDKLPYKTTYLLYRAKAIQCLDEKLIMFEPKSFLEKIIYDHVEYVFNETHEKEKYDSLRNNGVLRAKWNLTARYITYLKDKLNIDKKLNLTKLITVKCIEKWNETVDNINVYRNFLGEFIELLRRNSHEISSFRHANNLFEQILKDLEERLPLEDIYQTVWFLKLNIATRSIIVDGCDIKNEHNGLQILRESGVKLGKILVSVLQEFINKDIYWPIFDFEIRDFVVNETDSIARHLDGHGNKVEGSDIIVLVCNELTEEKRAETYFMAAKILQASYENTENVYYDEYKYVKHKLITFDDKEIKCYVYQKFVRNNNGGSTLI